MSRLVCRNRWRANQPVSPGKRCSDTTRPADTNARPYDMGQDHAVSWNEEPPLTGEEVVTIVSEVHAEGLSNAPRTSRQSVVEEGCLLWLLFSADTRVLCAFDDVARSNQTPVRLAQRPDDDVDGVMQPVREIAVEMTWWAKEGFVPIRLATIRVRTGITFAGVRFDLGDTDGNSLIGSRVLQYAAEQSWSDLEDVTSKEIASGKAHFVKVVHRQIVPVTLGHSNQLEIAR